MKQWIPTGLVLVALLAVASTWAWDHRAQVKLRTLAEAGELKAKGQLVVEQASAKEAKADAQDLLKKNADLKTLYAAALAAAPDASVSGSAQLSTGPVVAGTSPPLRPAPQPAVSSPSPPALGHDEVAGTSKRCLLSEGDMGEVRVDGIELQTKAGNRLIVGTGAAWKVSPGTPEKLFGGGFQAGLSGSSTVAEKAPPRWGAGLSAACAWGSACSVGPVLALPPVRLLGLQGELTVGATVSSKPVGMLTGVVRF